MQKQLLLFLHSGLFWTPGLGVFPAITTNMVKKTLDIFSEIDLTTNGIEINFEPIVLSNLNLSKCNFEGSKLNFFIFFGCNLSYSNFENATLGKNIFISCGLSKVILEAETEQELKNCNIYDSHFKLTEPIQSGCVSNHPTNLGKAKYFMQWDGNWEIN